MEGVILPSFDIDLLDQFPLLYGDVRLLVEKVPKHQLLLFIRGIIHLNFDIITYQTLLSTSFYQYNSFCPDPCTYLNTLPAISTFAVLKFSALSCLHIPFFRVNFPINSLSKLFYFKVMI